MRFCGEPAKEQVDPVLKGGKAVGKMWVCVCKPTKTPARESSAHTQHPFIHSCPHLMHRLGVTIWTFITFLAA